MYHSAGGSTNIFNSIYDSNGLNYEGDNFMPTVSSVCVDAGVNNFLPITDKADLDNDGDCFEQLPLDYENKPRINNGIVEIGAVERP